MLRPATFASKLAPIEDRRMKRSALAIAVLALGVPILAQTKTVTSPSGYENTEAPALAYYFVHREEIDRSIQEGKAFVEMLRGRIPSKVRRKLDGDRD